jgi:hypothetical protein
LPAGALSIGSCIFQGSADTTFNFLALYFGSVGITRTRYPGIRFRMIDEQDAIRRHIRIRVNQDEARTLEKSLAPSDEVIILQALSGG